MVYVYANLPCHSWFSESHMYACASDLVYRVSNVSLKDRTNQEKQEVFRITFLGRSACFKLDSIHLRWRDSPISPRSASNAIRRQSLSAYGIRQRHET